MTSSLQIAVVGAGAAERATLDLAHAVGTAIAEAGATLLTGGGAGVMRAAFDGATAAGGRTVAVRPDTGSADIAAYDVRIWTGLGQARNVVLVLSADAVIAVGGEWGTLSEIAMAVKHERPVVLLDSWRLLRPGGDPPAEITTAHHAREAVSKAIALVQ